MESVLFANAQNGQEMSNSGSWNAGASYGYFSDPTYTSIGEPYRSSLPTAFAFVFLKFSFFFFFFNFNSHTPSCALRCRYGDARFQVEGAEFQDELAKAGQAQRLDIQSVPVTLCG